MSLFIFLIFTFKIISVENDKIEFSSIETYNMFFSLMELYFVFHVVNGYIKPLINVYITNLGLRPITIIILIILNTLLIRYLTIKLFKLLRESLYPFCMVLIE